jgi:hypothetical protein
VTILETSQPVAVPDWFKPNNIKITDHAVQRFLERVNPYPNYSDARVIIEQSIRESYEQGLLTFQKTQTQPGWTASITSHQHDLIFLAIFPAGADGQQVARDPSGKLVLATIIDSPFSTRKAFKGNYQQACNELKQKGEALTMAKEKLAVARQEVNDFKGKYEAAFLAAEKYKARNIDTFVGLYSIYRHEKQRGLFASKKQLARLEELLEICQPGWRAIMEEGGGSGAVKE